MNARFYSLPAVALAALAAFANSAANADPSIYQHVLRSAVWIDNQQEKCFGSGVLVDLQNRLVMTNNHVVGDAREVRIYFSAYNENGELITDSHVYEENFRALEEEKIAMVGRVVARWKEKDLALVQLPALPNEAQALSLAAAAPEPGENIHCVGNSGVNLRCLWRYTRGFVRNVYGCPKENVRVIETDMATNPGDSGGPIVNDNGELVGLATRHRTDARLVTQAVEVQELRSILDWFTGSDSDSDDSPKE